MTFTVSGHPSGAYNGEYHVTSSEWVNPPTFENENGMYFYWYGDWDSGHCNFDDRLQDGTNDWHNGGSYAPGGSAPDLGPDDNGHMSLDFDVGAVEF